MCRMQKGKNINCFNSNTQLLQILHIYQIKIENRMQDLFWILKHIDHTIVYHHSIKYLLNMHIILSI